MARYKRNQVILHDATYGRIVRHLYNDYYEIVSCDRYWAIVREKDINTHSGDDEYHASYKGSWNNFSPLREKYPIFSKMPTLRRLKQRASRYKKNIWSKNRLDDFYSFIRQKHDNYSYYVKYRERFVIETEIEILKEMNLVGNYYQQEDGIYFENEIDAILFSMKMNGEI